MEEILASIRRIISEDGDEPKPEAESAPPPAPEPEMEEPEPIVELEPEPVYEPEPEPEPFFEPEPEPVFAAPPPPPPPPPPVYMRPMDDDELELTEVVEPVQRRPDPLFDEPVRRLPPLEPGEGLMSKRESEQASAAFLQLKGLLTYGPGGPRTVEELVEDMLRPMLREYLDRELPNLVERMVDQEIARLARGRK